MHEPKDDFCTVYVRIPVVQVPHHHTTWSSSLLHTVPVQVKTVHDSAPFWTDSVPAKKAFSPVCYVCGINAPAATPADVARQYQSIHMPCAACAALGKKPRTRGPSCAAATAPSSKKRKHQ